jgi:hypothetical protein
MKLYKFYFRYWFNNCLLKGKQSNAVVHILFWILIQKLLLNFECIFSYYYLIHLSLDLYLCNCKTNLSQLLTLPKHPSSPPFFSGVPVAWSLVFYVMFCRSLFVLFLLAKLCCLSFFDLWLLINPLVSSNFLNKIKAWIFYAEYRSVLILSRRNTLSVHKLHILLKRITIILQNARRGWGDWLSSHWFPTSRHWATQNYELWHPVPIRYP